MNTVDYKLGDALASYLVSGDPTPYDVSEIEHFQEWLTNENLGQCLGIVEGVGYCRTNDYDNLGQNCSIYRFRL